MPFRPRTHYSLYGVFASSTEPAELLRRRRPPPPPPHTRLSDKAPSEHGQQCCGGEVSLLLEPLRVVPAVAVFGVGHVGLELARILARHDLDWQRTDSRASTRRRWVAASRVAAARPAGPAPMIATSVGFTVRAAVLIERVPSRGRRHGAARAGMGLDGGVDFGAAEEALQRPFMARVRRRSPSSPAGGIREA